MINVIEQPSGIQSVGRRLPVALSVDGAVNTYPRAASFVFRFSGGGNGAGNGEAFVVGGVQFMTDSSTDYTATTFDNTGSHFFRALNAKKMFSANARFREWAVYIIRGDADTRLVIKDSRNRSYPPDEVAFNIAGLSGATGFTVSGSAGESQPLRLWYQWWRNEGTDRVPTPLTEQRDAPIDRYGRVELDALAAARRAVGVSIEPDLDETEPKLDFAFNRSIFLRYGTYTIGDGCQAAYGEAFQTEDYAIVNSLLQDDTAGVMAPYVFGRRKWLTDRSRTFSENLNGYAWAAIYVDSQTAPFRFVRQYFDRFGLPLRTVTWESNPPHDKGVYRVPIGGLNGVPEDLQGVAVRQTVVLNNPLGFGFVTGSETLDIRYADYDCKVAEVYFMENLGSYRTIQFDRIESRNLSLTAEEWQEYAPEDAGGSAVRHRGGTVQRVIRSEHIFRLSTDIVKQSDRRTIEELLESPAAYILTQQDGRPVTRRIIFDRSEFTVKNRDAGFRVTIPFKFNTPRRIR